MGNNDGNLGIGSKIFLGVIALCVIIGAGALLSSIVSIDAGSVGVVFDKQNGVIDPVPLNQGWRLVRPYGVSVIHYNTQIQVETATASAGTKDMQTVTTVVAVNFRIDPADAPWVHQNLGMSYKTVAIDNQIQEAVKAATAKYAAEELLPKREEAKQLIQTILSQALVANRIHVTGISITDFKFSPEYQKAVEDTQIAAKKVTQAENDLKRIKIEADQRIAQAEGEAKAITIQVEAINKAGGANYVALKQIEQWNGVYPQYYFNSGSQSSGSGLLINIPSPSSTK